MSTIGFGSPSSVTVGVDPAAPGHDRTTVDVVVYGDPRVTSGTLLLTGARPAPDSQSLPRLGVVVGEAVRGPGAPCGRNEPCPCGSGRKYKHCHRAGGLP